MKRLTFMAGFCCALLVTLAVGARREAINYERTEAKSRLAALAHLEQAYGALTNVLSQAAIDAAFSRPEQRKILYALAGVSQITADDARGANRRPERALTGGAR